MTTVVLQIFCALEWYRRRSCQWLVTHSASTILVTVCTHGQLHHKMMCVRAARLDKVDLIAKQCSKRGGILHLKVTKTDYLKLDKDVHVAVQGARRKSSHEGPSSNIHGWLDPCSIKVGKHMKLQNGMENIRSVQLKAQRTCIVQYGLYIIR